MDDSKANIELHRKERGAKRRHTCLTILLAGFLLFCVAVVIGIAWLRSYLLDMLSPEQHVEIRRAQTEIITLPPEWHKPAEPFPEAVYRFQQKFRSDMESLHEKYNILLNGEMVELETTSSESSLGFDPAMMDPMLMGLGNWESTGPMGLLERYKYDLPVVADEQRTSFALLLADLQPIIEDANKAVALEGYTLDSEFDSLGVMELTNFTKLMVIKAQDTALSGKQQDAVLSLLLILKLNKTRPQSPLTTHFISKACMAMSFDQLQKLAKATTDTVILRQMLNGINAVSTESFLTDPAIIENPYYFDWLSHLRYAAGNGCPVDLSPQTLTFNLYQYSWIRSGPYAKWIVATFPPSDFRHKYYLNSVRYRTGSTGFSVEEMLDRFLEFPDAPSERPVFYRLACGLLGFDLITYQYAYYGALNPGTESSSRFLSARASLDLTKLAIAARLVELDANQETPINGVVEKIKAYLPDVPVDPFSNAPYRLSPTNQFYSIGPDKVDNKLSVLYDPTNGTLSTGDMDFLPLKDPNVKEEDLFPLINFTL